MHASSRTKTKPNDRCRCGSGQKYKKCCTKGDQEERQATAAAATTTTTSGGGGGRGGGTRVELTPENLGEMLRNTGTREQVTKALAQRSTPTGEVEHEREFAFQRGFADAYLRAMDRCLPSFYELYGGTSHFVAVDLASGAAVFPYAYAKHFQKSAG